MHLIDWVHARWLIVVTTLAAIVAVVVAAIVLMALPATYFLEGHRDERGPGAHPLLRASGRVVKNACGIILLLLGMILALPGVPGQGLLTILIGLILLDLPGKRRLERRLILWGGFAERINRLRARFGRPPLVLAESADDPGERPPDV